jgi:hypothetical protein
VDWRQYQQAAADFFTELGMQAAVGAKVKGARSTHEIDVEVRFGMAGVDHLWVVECKYWKQPIPKEKVLVLKGVLEDVGADRGFLLSESAFQPGAVSAARLSSVTLSDLAGLREAAKSDLQAMRWNRLYDRLIECRAELNKLLPMVKRDDDVSIGQLMPGIESDEYFRFVGTTSLLDTGLQRARVGAFPAPYDWDDDGEHPAMAPDVETFLERAEATLDTIEVWAKRHVERLDAWTSAPPSP